MNSNYNLSELTLNDTIVKKYEVAVIPIGATEPHNYHLPYGTDFFHADYISGKSCELAEKEGASIIKLPAIPYGMDANMFKFPFAINVYQKTLNLFVKDIIDSLIINKIRKIVIINAHGGNDFKPFIRDLQPDIKAFVCYIDWWKVASDKYKEIFEYPDDHAGEMETSISLVMNPHLVHMENAKDGKFKKTKFEAINNGWVSIARRWDHLTESSGVGYPLKSSKEKGEAYLKITIERISKFLKELSHSEMNEKFPFDE
jgi:creatinine amidohydrolase